MGFKCPKCEYERQSEDIAPEEECPKCGIIYEKYLETQKKLKLNQPKSSPSMSSRWRLTIIILLPILVFFTVVGYLKKSNNHEKSKISSAAKSKPYELAHVNETGIWRVRNFVDEFKEPTENRYITNSFSSIMGGFSNTATESSPLRVSFIILEDPSVSIQLYEYNRNNPVKAYSTKEYTVLMQDSNGERFELFANNYSDRLSFDENDSSIIHNALFEGGIVKFSMFKNSSPTTKYYFTIENAYGYRQAYKELAN